MNPEEQIEAFIQYMLDNERSQNTIDAYIVSVRKYFTLFDEITKKNMIAFKQKMIESFSPATAANNCIAMNQFCTFIGKPECKVKGIKIPKRTNVENVITVEEYQKLLSCLKADGKEDVYWKIRFLAQTGARASEFSKFEKKHLEAGQAVFWTKGKIRKILIPDKLIEESREYFQNQKNDTNWLFPNRYGEQMGKGGLKSCIERYGLKYGIRKEVCHPHSFRHLYAIQFLKTSNNIALLADLMGHEDVNTTAIYLKLSEKEQKQILDKVNW